MFQGDEVGAIVIDIGSSVTKAGFAGDDHPKAVYPSAVGVKNGEGANFVGEGAQYIGDDKPAPAKYFVGSETLSTHHNHTSIQYPCEQGLIKDWEAAEKLWDYGYNRLRVESKDHPLLMVEPSYNTRQNRERLTELAFEKYNAPAMFVAKDAVLTCFASGRATGLVLDSGGGKTSVTAVYDGYALQPSIIKTSFAGDRLDRLLYNLIQSKTSAPILPHYVLRKDSSLPKPSLLSLPNTHPTFTNFSIFNIVADIRQAMCQVHDTSFDPAHTNVSAYTYELPDGTNLDFGIERISIPETLFTTDLSRFVGGELESGHIPYQKMIYQGISMCDSDIRKEMYNGIIVTGGNTLYNGFTDRLTNELSYLISQKLKIYACNASTERRFGAWIGGSILASLGSFHQLWMSKAEYDERGKTLVEKKCP